MTVLIVGGSKSGKSDFAQQVALTLAKGAPHYYVATMIPGDKEDDARIRSHLQRREGMGFQTVECGRDILSSLAHTDKTGTFLLDSVTTLLTNEFFKKENGYQPDDAAAARCQKDLCTFAQTVQNAVIVSDAVFADAMHFDPTTDAYRRHLGALYGRS